MSASSQKEPLKNMQRRDVLRGAAHVALGAFFFSRSDAVLAAPSHTVDPTKKQGRPVSAIGVRSSFEQPRRLPGPAVPSSSSRSPLQDFKGIITPADLHFERHHGGIPEIAPTDYKLLIHGMVERPMTFDLRALKRFPSVSRFYFMECSGNGAGAFYTNSFNEKRTPQQLDGLTSTSEWIGVPLATLFREVGVKPEAKWFLAEGSDAAVMTRSIPVDKGWHDALIAYGQNGEAIRPEQGYPARLFLPGWEGNASVKWLRRIELSDAPFMTREETSKYTDPLKNGLVRQFSFVMDAKSIITFPSFPWQLTDAGWWEIEGLAWSGRGRISSVEISTDSGRSWQEATLQDPVLPLCHTRFTHMWRWDGNETTILSRAIDETGYVQPDRRTLVEARGEGTAYHYNNIRGWRIQRDGKVLLADLDRI